MEHSSPTGMPLRPGRTVAVRVLGFLAGLVIGLAVLIILTTPGGIGGMYSAWTLPPELRGALLVMREGEGDQAVAYRHANLFYQQISSHTATGNSVALEEGNVLMVREVADGYLLEEDGVTRIESNRQIAAPAQAPTGELVAFSEFVGDSHSEAASTSPVLRALVNPSEWELKLYSSRSNATARIGAGYGPVFLTDQTILFLAGDGMYHYDLGTGVSTKLLDRPFPIIIGPVLQSPDRTLIAFRDPARRSTVVYRIEATTLSLVHEVPELLFSPALSNTALYDVRGTADGGEVRAYTFTGGGPRLVHTFPVEMAVARIVF